MFWHNLIAYLTVLQGAQPGATPDVRSMAPSKRRKTSAASQPASGNTTQGVRTRRSAGARGDVPDAPDADLADLDAEPEVLLCPITRVMFRDPVMVVDSGHTYERSAILSHFERNGAKDPLTRRALSSTCLLYTSPSPRDRTRSRMPSSA